MAHRRGVGNVVWLSYTCGPLGHPTQTKPSLIWSGSTRLAFTVQGARALRALILDAKPQHVDMWLRSELEACWDVAR